MAQYEYEVVTLRRGVLAARYHAALAVGCFDRLRLIATMPASQQCLGRPACGGGYCGSRSRRHVLHNPPGPRPATDPSSERHVVVQEEPR